MNDEARGRTYPVGLLFRLEAEPGREDDVARFLEDRLPEVLEELPITVWHALRFHPLSFGVFVAFPDRAGQEAHVGDRIAAAVREEAGRLLRSTNVDGFDVVASGAAQGAPPVAG